MSHTLKIRRIDTLIIAAALILAAALMATAGAAPVVDGRFDPAEGYTSGHWVLLNVEGGKNQPLIPADNGQIWLFEDSDGDIYGNFILPLTLVDNTYGSTAIGWGAAAPSGKNHKFDDLKGSDSAEFRFRNGDGDVVLDFQLDYISSSSSAPGGYISLGATGGDGKVLVGSAADILAWATSLAYNFNDLGHVLTQNSPATDQDYTENPLYPGWVFEVSYEFKISGDVFGPSGFGSIQMPLMHVSPNKIGGNKVFDEVDGEVPEPATVALLGLGGLLLRRRTA